MAPARDEKSWHRPQTDEPDPPVLCKLPSSHQPLPPSTHAATYRYIPGHLPQRYIARPWKKSIVRIYGLGAQEKSTHVRRLGTLCPQRTLRSGLRPTTLTPPHSSTPRTTLLSPAAPPHRFWPASSLYSRLLICRLPQNDRATQAPSPLPRLHTIR